MSLFPPSAETPVAGAAVPGPRRRSWRLRLLAVPGTLWVLLALVIGFTLVDPRFLASANLQGLAYALSPLLLVATGMTLVILTRGIDLSSASVVGLSGVATGLALHFAWPVPAAALLGLAVGTGCGLMNGMLVSVGRVAPFVATLGTTGVGAGVAIYLTNGTPVVGFGPTISTLGSGAVGPVPTAFVLAGAVFLAFAAVLGGTRFGAHVRAVGGNPEATRLAGIAGRRVVATVYGLAGLLSALAALLILARDDSAAPRPAVGIEFDAIAAVVLGGASFDDGRGSLWGTLAGAATIALVRNGLTYTGIPTNWQLPVTGTVIILAIAAANLQQRHLRRVRDSWS